MFQDIFLNHKVYSSSYQIVAIVFVFSVATLLLLWRPMWQLGLGILPKKKINWMVAAVIIAVAMLVAQWHLLPASQIRDYQGSVIQFLLWQGGNIAFLGCYFLGLHTVLHDCGRKELEPFVWGSALISVFAVLALIISSFLVYTNWMLRIVYYWIPFAAPICAVGISGVISACGKFRYLAFVGLVGMSLSHLLRIPAL